MPIICNPYWNSLRLIAQNSFDLTNYSPWYVVMLDTGISCTFSCVKNNLTTSSGGRFFCVLNVHNFLVFTHTANNTHLNSLIDISFKKNNSMCISFTDLKLSVLVVTPFGRLIIEPLIHMWRTFSYDCFILNIFLLDIWLFLLCTFFLIFLHLCVLIFYELLVNITLLS